MDKTLRQLLDAIPDRAPRSKLEPHAEVIRELRKKRRTYVEIAAFFRDYLQLTVAPSTIHDFVKARARRARQGIVTPELPTPVLPAVSSEIPAGIAPASSAMVDRIRAIRKEPVTPKSQSKQFQFDPQEPLTLNPKPKEK